MPSANSSPWVVVPTYNEKLNIAPMIAHLFSISVANLSVLVVDDNSPDGTGKIVKSLMAQHKNLHLLERPIKNGLGRAYIDGFSYALSKGATAIVQMDADFSHNPDDIPRLLAKLQQNDLVIGSRYSNGISVINWPLRRLLLSSMANIYVSTITGLPFKDSTGGFRAWRTSVLKQINFNRVKADGYGFQVVMLHRVWKLKASIVEIPIIFTERREGQSKMSKAIIFEAIWLVWRLRLLG